MKREFLTSVAFVAGISTLFASLSATQTAQEKTNV
jgi:hypothetical protein